MKYDHVFACSGAKLNHRTCPSKNNDFEKVTQKLKTA
jgi:hypothetical protein